MAAGAELAQGALPLTPGSTLVWAGFTPEGQLAAQDSAGEVRVAGLRWGAWAPLFSAEAGAAAGVCVADASREGVGSRGVTRHVCAPSRPTHGGTGGAAHAGRAWPLAPVQGASAPAERPSLLPGAIPGSHASHTSCCFPSDAHDEHTHAHTPSHARTARQGGEHFWLVECGLREVQCVVLAGAEEPGVSVGTAPRPTLSSLPTRPGLLAGGSGAAQEEERFRCLWEREAAQDQAALDAARRAEDQARRGEGEAEGE